MTIKETSFMYDVLYCTLYDVLYCTLYCYVSRTVQNRNYNSTVLCTVFDEEKYQKIIEHR
jgi:hypothetical protein